MSPKVRHLLPRLFRSVCSHTDTVLSLAKRPPPFAPFDPESDPIMILAAAAAAVNDEDRKRQSQDESGG